MAQTLLKGNQRFGALGMAISCAGFVVGMVLLLSALPIVLRGLGLLLISSSAIASYLLWEFLKRPRLAISENELWVYIQPAKQPFQVPLDAVEVFFMGQGPVKGDEPGQPTEYEGAVAANVIVRIAEAATEWHNKDVNLWLGVWREGYITVRGLWCEDINQDLLKKMNRKLLDTKRQLRELGA